MQTLEKMTLTVPDISCGHCEQTIREEIGKMGGVAAVTPSALTKLVVLEYDPAKVSLDTIKEKLAAVGYPVAG